MAYPTSDSTFKIKISTTKQTVSSFSPDTTLSGRGIGLRDLDYPVTRETREIMGFYAGIREEEDVKRATGTLTFSVDLNDTTKALVNKDGQYIAFEHVYRVGNTVKMTVKGQALIKESTPTEGSDGEFMLTITGPLIEDLQVT